MPKRMQFKERKQQRREEAKVRQEARNKRTDAQQLALLKKKGHGESKEAHELVKKIRKPTPPPGKYHSTKKGKKGYDRKRSKRSN